MGMDLQPIAPTEDAPKDKYGYEWGHYNWIGWTTLIRLLKEWGIDISEFSESNDGEVISQKTCLLVADAIERHLTLMDEDCRRWLEPHITLWRTCGGYEQR